MRAPQLMMSGLMVLALAACSNDKGDGDKKAQPQTPEEALQSLPEYHRTAFENWKNQVAKSCGAADALGLSNGGGSMEIGIDAKAILARNAGSLAFTNAEGTLFLTGFNSLNGQATTETEASSEVDGVSTVVKGSTKRSGSYCEVYIYGQKVYETTLARSFVVGAELRADKKTAAVNTRARVENVGSIGSAIAYETGVSEALTEAMKPTAPLRDAFARALGLTEDLGPRLLQLSPYPQVTFATKLQGEVSSVWTLGDSRSLVASRAVLGSLFAGQNRTVSVNLLVKLPVMKFADVENVADKSSFNANAHLLQERNGAGTTLRLEQMTLGGRKAFNAEEAHACLNERLSAILAPPQGKNEISPSLGEAVGPCRLLNADLEETMYTSGLMKDLLATVYAGVQPSPVFRHNGWESVLSRLVKENLDAGQDLVRALDPQNLTRVIPLLQSSTSVIRGELGRLQNGAALKTSLDDMAIGWALIGQQVEMSRIGHIIYSADISANPYLVSTQRMLGDLSREPYARDAELQFALTMAPEYKAEGTQALALAKELDEKHFEREIFNQVIQKRIALTDLQSYTRALNVAKTELAKYPNLAPLKSQLASLTTTWLKNGAFTAGEIPSVYQAVSNVIDAFPASTAEMLKSFDAGGSEARSALAYARELNAELKAQSLKIAEDAKAAGHAQWGAEFLNSILQRRPAPAQIRAWSSMWSSINAFVARETQRLAGESAIGAEWRRKAIIERAIKETWTELEFNGLEAIAQVAIYKTMCERHKDVASQVDCAGGSLFSKESKKFFDPAFQNRYTGLAADLRGAISQMSDFKWVSIKGELLREFFGSFEPMWSRCDNAAFAQRSTELKLTLNQALSETDSFRRFDHERRIRELVRNCN
ncbi:MAG: hypothetical protein KF767_00905 [Bdellovibrionaceae bacterium]|nr:hypothetical protein [Pseudobdellovibrionaceae bacterium]